MTGEELLELRLLATEWHGGQFSPLYAFQSTGSVVPGLFAEAWRCALYADANGMPEEAEALRRIAKLDTGEEQQ